MIPARSFALQRTFASSLTRVAANPARILPISKTQSLRTFSSNPDPSSQLKPSKLEEYKEKFSAAIPRIKTYAIASGVALGIYAVFDAGLSLVEFMSSINFADVGEVAFFAGVLTTLGCGVLIRIATRFLRLDPERIYKAQLQKVLKHPKVIAELGEPLKPSNFRAYTFKSGGLRWGQEADAASQRAYNIKDPNFTAWDKYYRPRQVQLFFQIAGSKGNGMVSVEVEKNLRGVETLNLLCLDTIESGVRVVLEGDPTHSIYQGIVRLR